MQDITIIVTGLREKMEKGPSKPKPIVTVRGIGYRFEPQT